MEWGGNCPLVPNPQQDDANIDALGDACDPETIAGHGGDRFCGLDADGDGVGDACDNCVKVKNPTQPDLDTDQNGDVCDGTSRCC